MAAIDRVQQNRTAVVSPEPAEVETPRETPATPTTGYSYLNSFVAFGAGRTNLTGTTALEEKRANAETAALAKLPVEQREQYQAVQASVANDPAAASALRSLLMNGKLTRSNAFDGSGKLLDHLSKLADPSTAVQPGVNREELLGQILKDVQRPFSIDQGRGNYFCGAAAVSTGLAYKNPAEYARLAVGLGTEGRVQLAGTHRRDAADGSYKKGDHIELTLEPEALQTKGRSSTQQLLAPALTEFANGDNYDVDAKGVSHRTAGSGRQDVRGLYSNQVADMQSAVFGRGFKSFRIDHEHAKPAEERKAEKTAQELVQQQVAAGVQVAIKIDNHWVNVTAFDGTNFTYTDSQGKSATVPAAEIFNNAEAITYEAAEVDNPTEAAIASTEQPPPAEEEAGGGTSSSGSTTDPDDRH